MVPAKFILYPAVTQIVEESQDLIGKLASYRVWQGINFTFIADLADMGECDCCSGSKCLGYSTLFDTFKQFTDLHFALFDFQPPMLGHLNDGFAGDTMQNRLGMRRNQRIPDTEN